MVLPLCRSAVDSVNIKIIYINVKVKWIKLDIPFVVLGNFSIITNLTLYLNPGVGVDCSHSTIYALGVSRIRHFWLFHRVKKEPEEGWRVQRPKLWDYSIRNGQIIKTTPHLTQIYTDKTGELCTCVIFYLEMDTTPRVQILIEAVYISHRANTLGKGMNLAILPPAIVK